MKQVQAGNTHYPEKSVCKDNDMKIGKRTAKVHKKAQKPVVQALRTTGETTDNCEDDYRISKHEAKKNNALAYLYSWHEDRLNWKFVKKRQVWLMENACNMKMIRSKQFPVLLEYLSSIKGNAKQKVIKYAHEQLDTNPDTIAQKRARKILQSIPEDEMEDKKD